MSHYSDFFKTLHDETSPTGYLGRGTHYSVFRAVVFHDPTGDPLPEGQFADFAVIWDEDHDMRVFEPIEEVYRRGLLSSFVMFGERKGCFTAILSEKARGKLFSRADERGSLLTREVHAICQSLDDPWASQVVAADSAENSIINDNDAKVKVYLQNLQMLWRLGMAEARRKLTVNDDGNLPGWTTDPWEADRGTILDSQFRKIFEVRSDGRTAKGSDVAEQLSEGLAKFMGNYPGGQAIGLGCDNNQVSLQGQSTKKMLQITCNGPDMFRLKGDIAPFRQAGFQTKIGEPRRAADDTGPLTRNEMASIVIAWVKAQRSV
jgi:hypothetical protein